MSDSLYSNTPSSYLNDTNAQPEEISSIQKKERRSRNQRINTRNVPQSVDLYEQYEYIYGGFKNNEETQDHQLNPTETNEINEESLQKVVVENQQEINKEDELEENQRNKSQKKIQKKDQNKKKDLSNSKKIIEEIKKLHQIPKKNEQKKQVQQAQQKIRQSQQKQIIQKNEQNSSRILSSNNKGILVQQGGIRNMKMNSKQNVTALYNKISNQIKNNNLLSVRSKSALDKKNDNYKVTNGICLNFNQEIKKRNSSQQHIGNSSIAKILKNNQKNSIFQKPTAPQPQVFFSHSKTQNKSNNCTHGSVSHDINISHSTHANQNHKSLGDSFDSKFSNKYQNSSKIYNIILNEAVIKIQQCYRQYRKNKQLQKTQNLQKLLAIKKQQPTDHRNTLRQHSSERRLKSVETKQKGSEVESLKECISLMRNYFKQAQQ